MILTALYVDHNSMIWTNERMFDQPMCIPLVSVWEWDDIIRHWSSGHLWRIVNTVSSVYIWNFYWLDISVHHRSLNITSCSDCVNLNSNDSQDDCRKCRLRIDVVDTAEILGAVQLREREISRLWTEWMKSIAKRRCTLFLWLVVSCLEVSSYGWQLRACIELGIWKTRFTR